MIKIVPYYRTLLKFKNKNKKINKKELMLKLMLKKKRGINI